MIQRCTRQKAGPGAQPVTDAAEGQGQRQEKDRAGDDEQGGEHGDLGDRVTG